MAEKHADYCVTAAKHENKTNHIASSFYTWEWRYDKEKDKYLWCGIGWKNSSFIAELVIKGKLVITGKEVPGKLENGSPIEVELRVKSNGEKHKITSLPDSR